MQFCIIPRTDGITTGTGFNLIIGSYWNINNSNNNNAAAKAAAKAAPATTIEILTRLLQPNYFSHKMIAIISCGFSCFPNKQRFMLGQRTFYGRIIVPMSNSLFMAISSKYIADRHEINGSNKLDIFYESSTLYNWRLVHWLSLRAYYRK